MCKDGLLSKQICRTAAGKAWNEFILVISMFKELSSDRTISLLQQFIYSTWIASLEYYQVYFGRIIMVKVLYCLWKLTAVLKSSSHQQHLLNCVLQPGFQ